MSKKADILVPLFTTFNKDGSIDYDTFAKIERYVLDKGADGVYVGGSSAECFSLTQEERKKVLELAVKVADGKQVVAHVGAIGTGIACDLAAHAKKRALTPSLPFLRSITVSSRVRSKATTPLSRTLPIFPLSFTMFPELPV